MVRGQSFLLPSGEAVAEELGRPEEEIEKISKAARKDEPGLGAGTPLWYYILKEAELIGREEPGTPEKRKGKGRKRSPAKNTKPGEGLGPVGATLVAEVIIGLIELDPRSWLGANRNWHPETYAHDAGVEMSTVGNLLAYGSAEAPSV